MSHNQALSHNFGNKYRFLMRNSSTDLSESSGHNSTTTPTHSHHYIHNHRHHQQSYYLNQHSDVPSLSFQQGQQQQQQQHALIETTSTTMPTTTTTSNSSNSSISSVELAATNALRTVTDLARRSITAVDTDTATATAAAIDDDVGVGSTISASPSVVVVKKASGFQSSLLDKLNEQRMLIGGDGSGSGSGSTSSDGNDIIEQAVATNICDLAINVENRTYYAHKCLLVASCDYFAAMMLRSGMLETRQDCIELKGVSALGLRTVLDFVYTGELRLTLANVADVLRAVSHLQVKYALELCEEFLCEQINENNCIDILNLIDLFSIKDIKLEIDSYILRNFEKLVQNEQYKRLRYDQFKFYLASNKLKLFPEIKVFNACLNWWRSYIDTNNMSSNNNSSSQQQQSLTSEESAAAAAAAVGCFYDLAKLVRYHTMRAEEFINVVAKCELMKSDAACHELLIQGYEYFALPSKQYTCTAAQSCIRNEPVMVCVNESMYVLNRKEDCWQYLCQSHATSKILSQKFVVVNNFLYACGGYSEKERETCDKCYRFDPRNGQWQSIASMNEKRQFFTLAACSDTIVAVGGVFGSIGNFYATFPISSPIELYSIDKNEWRSLPLDETQVPILKWPGVCIFRRKRTLADDQTSPNSSELNSDSGGGGGGGDSQHLFVFVVCGKHIKKNTLSDEQAFLVDVERNAVELCPAPLTARFNPSVFYYDNRIVLFAGEDEKFRLAPCIESYDLRTRQWTEIAQVPISLSYQCISSTRMLGARISYIIEEHDGPFSETYVLRSASFDIDRNRFEATIELPIPSTLASKWCYLVFPREFLDKYYSIDTDDVISLASNNPRS